MVGHAQKKRFLLSLSLTRSFLVCVPHPVAPTRSLLSLWFLTNTHSRQNIVWHRKLLPHRLTHRCVTAQTSTCRERTGRTCFLLSPFLPSSALPFLFITISHRERGFNQPRCIIHGAGGTLNSCRGLGIKLYLYKCYSQVNRLIFDNQVVPNLVEWQTLLVCVDNLGVTLLHVIYLQSLCNKGRLSHAPICNSILSYRVVGSN